MATSEIFKFVTVRNPKNLSNGFYDQSLKAPQDLRGLTFFKDLETILKNTNLSNNEKIIDIREYVNQLQSLQNYNTLTYWQNTAPFLEGFIEEYIAYAPKNRNLQWYNGLKTKYSVPNQISDAVLLDAWTALCLFNIVGGNKYCIQFTMNLIRMSDLIIKAAVQGFNFEQFNFDNKIILPKELFPLPKAEGASVLVDQDNKVDPQYIALINDLIETSEKLSDAKEDLKEQYAKRLALARKIQKEYNPYNWDQDGNPIPSNPIPDELLKMEYFDNIIQAKLKQSTLDIIESNNLKDSNYTTAFIIEALDTKLKESASKFSKSLSVSFDDNPLGTSIDSSITIAGGGFTYTGGVSTIGGEFGVVDATWPPITYTDSPSSCTVQPLGIGDYRKVEQTLICNRPGDVAHIENILKGESKERETRRLNRTEDTFASYSSVESFDERDTITTDRYQMEKATQKILNKDAAIDIGVSVSGTYGLTSVSATSGFSTSSSSSVSDQQAVSYAKDVTERARKEVITKNETEQIRRVVEEFEEKNKHTIDNQDGSDHTVGIYRWVDKVYRAQVVNYGKRLMYEFMIPDPAAFHRFAMTEKSVDTEVTAKRPFNPISDIAYINTLLGTSLSPLRSPNDLTTSNYLFWLGLYNVSSEAPPEEFTTISTSHSIMGMFTDGTKHNVINANDLVVPDGYRADIARVKTARGIATPLWSDSSIGVMVGTQYFYSAPGGGDSAFFVMNNENAVIPVGIFGRADFVLVAVEIRCARLESSLQTWKINTFNAIMSAYENLEAQYNNAISEAKAQLGVQIRSQNPRQNRITELTELKKHAVRLLMSCTFVPSEAMKAHYYGGTSYPDFNCCQAINDGKLVNFVENCFEFDLMTYKFYPYFWSRKNQWLSIYQIEDADPVFQQFLQAGYVRVVVPVRPGYEQAALRFSTDGSLWNGHEDTIPTLDDPYYLSLMEELAEPVGEPEGEPWEIVLPSTLTILQKNAEGIDESGLPCDSE